MTHRASGSAPVLGLGTAPIGNLYRPVPEEDAHDTLAEAWARGIRYFDTAPHYGLGLAERRLGRFLAEHRGDDVIVSTKVGRLLEPNPDYDGGTDLANGFAVPDDLRRRFDPSEDGIRRSLDASLERLGLDRVDILFLHDPDAYDLDRGLREGLPALQRLRDEGLVDRIGVGVNDAAVAARAVREGDLDVVMIAGRHTLLDRSAEDELFPVCADRGVRVIAAAPYNSGLLATDSPQDGGTYDYAAVSPEILERARLLARICERHGARLPSAAIQYPARHDLVDAVVVGSSRPAAVAENVDRFAQRLPRELWADLRSAEAAR